jgi:hypothetical protein
MSEAESSKSDSSEMSQQSEIKIELFPVDNDDENVFDRLEDLNWDAHPQQALDIVLGFLHDKKESLQQVVPRNAEVRALLQEGFQEIRDMVGLLTSYVEGLGPTWVRDYQPQIDRLLV